MGDREDDDNLILLDIIPPQPDDLDLYLDIDMDMDPAVSISAFPPPPNSTPSDASFSIHQIEDFLFDDHFSQDPSTYPQLDDFLSDILLDSPLPLTDPYYPSSSSSYDDDTTTNNYYIGNNPSPEIGSLPSPPPNPNPNDKDKDSSHHHPQELQLQQLPSPPLSHSSHSQPQDDNIVNDDAASADDPAAAAADDDPVTKKRRRQLRNRDAAVRSRERKKMYVKDLEIKSRFYESECRRLGMLLQCYLAENHALRLSLHNNSQAFGASPTKQESAVLFLESLLLGSLLWFLGIIGLLILPRQLLSILEAGQMESAGSKNLGSLAPREAGSNVVGTLEFQNFMISKKCRGSRRRMRCFSSGLRNLGNTYFSHPLASPSMNDTMLIVVSN